MTFRAIIILIISFLVGAVLFSISDKNSESISFDASDIAHIERVERFMPDEKAVSVHLYQVPAERLRSFTNHYHTHFVDVSLFAHGPVRMEISTPIQNGILQLFANKSVIEDFIQKVNDKENNGKAIRLTIRKE
jgi:hypothetical protein